MCGLVPLSVLNADLLIANEATWICLYVKCSILVKAMYYAGAEISRIEETLYRLGKAYGAEHMNVYAITSSILITMEFRGNGSGYSKSKNQAGCNGLVQIEPSLSPLL